MQGHVRYVRLEPGVVLESKGCFQRGPELRAVLNLYVVHVSLTPQNITINIHATCQYLATLVLKVFSIDKDIPR